jgi:lysozyme
MLKMQMSANKYPKNPYVRISIGLIAILVVVLLSIEQKLPNLILARNYVQGIDISNHNPDIDWPAMKKANIKFAYIKRSEGTGYTDPLFEKHKQGASSQNILWGPYHYYRFDTDPVEQARNYYNLLPKGVDMLVPAVDVELSDSGLLPSQESGNKQLIQFSDQFELLSGHRPIYYTTHAAYDKYFANTQGQDDLLEAVWIRSISGRPNVTSWSIWQYSDRGDFGNTAGSIDRNAFRGNQSELEKLTVKLKGGI